MDLFSILNNESRNLLHKDGEVYYYGGLLNEEKANYYFNCFLESINWQFDEVIIYGKRIVTKRKIAWYGDQLFKYTYSNTTKTALLWTPELFALKKIVEQKTKQTYNSCLLNLYHNGFEGMSWHSDSEKELGNNSIIASVSLGAARKFAFKHKQTKEKTDLILEHGSLLVMKGETQKYWLHQLPQTKLVRTPRVNLTFRTIV